MRLVCVVLALASSASAFVGTLPRGARAPAARMCDTPPARAERTPEERKQMEMAKARRTAANFGTGGVRAGRKSKGKKTEQKKAGEGKGFGASAGLNFDRTPDGAADCGCCSGKSYASCCQPLHGGAAAESASALVRARYTAYQYRKPDYLMSSTDPEGPEWEPDAGRWKKSLLSFCDDFVFQKLKVGEEAQTGEGEASVEFVADFVQKGTINLMSLRETSVCVRRGSQWLYVAGTDEYESPTDD